MNVTWIVHENAVHWEWLVYLEMYIAGIAGGSYVLAAILEFLDRGDSRVARAAHLIAFPLMAAAGLLLIVDLSRPERFWHMVVQSKTMLPMIKLWSPMSLGSWGVLLFPAIAFVSFLDALVASGLLRFGPWRPARTLHGNRVGKVLALGGGLTAFLVTAYSGILLTVTNLPGWANSPFVGPLYVATAIVTGLAAMLLISWGWAGRNDPGTQALLRASPLLIGWQMLMLVVWIATLGAGLAVYLSSIDVVMAIVGAVVLGGVVPALVLLGPLRGLKPSMTGVVVGLSILVGGFLIRYAVVMGPQHYV